MIQKATEKLSLREATLEDARMLYEWANDECVRNNAFSKEPIPWEEHLIWYQKKIVDTKCQIYIIQKMDAENKKVPIGQIRIDQREGNGEIDISIAAPYRNEGFGRIAFSLVLEQIKRDMPQIEKLVAKVKKKNLASIKALQMAGFILTKQNEQYDQLEKWVTK